ncbi:hypothetical protein ACLKA7_001326 [Drosophila subpalustris]
MQTDRLWELSQRHRLVSGVDKTAAVALLSACHAAYQPIYYIIQNLHEKLAEIADRVAELDRECFDLNEEHCQVGHQRCQLESSADRNAWLFQTLNVLQTQAKYLDMHARSLAPSLVQSSTVKLLKEAMQLVKQYKSNFSMGFARAAS